MPVKWVPEIRHYCPRVPFLLVGTQADLREDEATLVKLAKNQQRPISREAGEKMAKSVKAAKYMECSALTREGVKNVFDEAIFQHLEEVNNPKIPKKKRLCSLL